MTAIRQTRLRILGVFLSRRMQGKPPPSVRDLCKMLGHWPNSVHGHIRALQRDGLIDVGTASSRAVETKCRFIPVEAL